MEHCCTGAKPGPHELWEDIADLNCHKQELLGIAMRWALFLTSVPEEKERNEVREGEENRQAEDREGTAGCEQSSPGSLLGPRSLQVRSGWVEGGPVWPPQQDLG